MPQSTVKGQNKVRHQSSSFFFSWSFSVSASSEIEAGSSLASASSEAAGFRRGFSSCSSFGFLHFCLPVSYLGESSIPSSLALTFSFSKSSYLEVRSEFSLPHKFRFTSNSWSLQKLGYIVFYGQLMDGVVTCWSRDSSGLPAGLGLPWSSSCRWLSPRRPCTCRTCPQSWKIGFVIIAKLWVPPVRKSRNLSLTSSGSCRPCELLLVLRKRLCPWFWAYRRQQRFRTARTFCTGKCCLKIANKSEVWELPILRRFSLMFARRRRRRGGLSLWRVE